MNQAVGNHAVKEFFTSKQWDMIYNLVGLALDDDEENPETVYEIRNKIHTIFDEE
jgi:hypothetical protein